MTRCVAMWRGSFEVSLPLSAVVYTADEVDALVTDFGGSPKITYPLAEPERYLKGLRIRGDTEGRGT